MNGLMEGTPPILKKKKINLRMDQVKKMKILPPVGNLDQNYGREARGELFFVPHRSHLEEAVDHPEVVSEMKKSKKKKKNENLKIMFRFHSFGE